MRKSIILLSLVSIAALLLSYSCKNANNEKEAVNDIVGVWWVDSITTRFYPTDSLLYTYFSDTMRQKVVFNDDNLYETVVWQKGDTVQASKMVYKLCGDTITYEQSNGETLMEEYIALFSDTAMVTQCAVTYSDNTAEIYTVYYSRDKNSGDAAVVTKKQVADSQQ